MKKILPIIIVLLALGIIFIAIINSRNNISQQNNNQIINNSKQDNLNYSNITNNNLNNSQNDNSNTANLNSPYFPPITDFQQRVTKKPFGIYITPQDSPVQSERFQGYHTGIDFEILPDEENVDLPIYAFCNGKIIMKEYASGYGGVLVQSCTIENQLVTIIYGHLKLVSINKNVDGTLKKGEMIGALGKGYSTETDGERKHLHFGIHKGTAVTILGYVQVKSELNNWIDPMTLL